MNANSISVHNLRKNSPASCLTTLPFKSLAEGSSVLSVKTELGKAQRSSSFSIICAISHHPDILILDEAATGLDPVVRDEILDLFMDFIQDEKHSILFSTHIISDIQKIADHVILIHNGKMILALYLLRGSKSIALESITLLLQHPEIIIILLFGVVILSYILCVIGYARKK